MKKLIFKSDPAYESPVCRQIETRVEGVLCASPSMSTETYEGFDNYDDDKKWY